MKQLNLEGKYLYHYYYQNHNFMVHKHNQQLMLKGPAFVNPSIDIKEDSKLARDHGAGETVLEVQSTVDTGMYEGMPLDEHVPGVAYGTYITSVDDPEHIQINQGLLSEVYEGTPVISNENGFEIWVVDSYGNITELVEGTDYSVIPSPNGKSRALLEAGGEFDKELIDGVEVITSSSNLPDDPENYPYRITISYRTLDHLDAIVATAVSDLLDDFRTFGQDLTGTYPENHVVDERHYVNLPAGKQVLVPMAGAFYNHDVQLKSGPVEYVFSGDQPAGQDTITLTEISGYELLNSAGTGDEWLDLKTTKGLYNGLPLKADLEGIQEDTYIQFIQGDSIRISKPLTAPIPNGTAVMTAPFLKPGDIVDATTLGIPENAVVTEVMPDTNQFRIDQNLTETIPDGTELYFYITWVEDADYVISGADLAKTEMTYCASGVFEFIVLIKPTYVGRIFVSYHAFGGEVSRWDFDRLRGAVASILNFLDNGIFTVDDHLREPDPHPQYQLLSEKNEAFGYPTLNENKKVPRHQLPESVVHGLRYRGSYSAQTNDVYPDYIDIRDYTVAGNHSSGTETLELTSTEDLKEGDLVDDTHSAIPSGTKITAVDHEGMFVTLNNTLVDSISDGTSVTFYLVVSQGDYYIITEAGNLTQSDYPYSKDYTVDRNANATDYTLDGNHTEGASTLTLQSVDGLQADDLLDSSLSGIADDTVIQSVDTSNLQITLSKSIVADISGGTVIPIYRNQYDSGVNQLTLTSVSDIQVDDRLDSSHSAIPSDTFVTAVNMDTRQITISNSTVDTLSSGDGLSVFHNTHHYDVGDWIVFDGSIWDKISRDPEQEIQDHVGSTDPQQDSHDPHPYYQFRSEKDAPGGYPGLAPDILGRDGQLKSERAQNIQMFDAVVYTSDEFIQACQDPEIVSIYVKGVNIVIDQEVQIAYGSAAKIIRGERTVDPTRSEHSITLDGNGALRINPQYSTVFENLTVDIRHEGEILNINSSSGAGEVMFHNCYLGAHGGENWLIEGDPESTGSGSAIHHVVFNHCMFEGHGIRHTDHFRNLDIEKGLALVGSKGEGLNQEARNALRVVHNSHLESDTLDRMHADQAPVMSEYMMYGTGGDDHEETGTGDNLVTRWQVINYLKNLPVTRAGPLGYLPPDIKTRAKGIIGRGEQYYFEEVNGDIYGLYMSLAGLHENGRRQRDYYCLYCYLTHDPDYPDRIRIQQTDIEYRPPFLQQDERVRSIRSMNEHGFLAWIWNYGDEYTSNPFPRMKFYWISVKGEVTPDNVLTKHGTLDASEHDYVDLTFLHDYFQYEDSQTSHPVYDGHIHHVGIDYVPEKDVFIAVPWNIWNNSQDIFQVYVFDRQDILNNQNNPENLTPLAKTTYTDVVGSNGFVTISDYNGYSWYRVYTRVRDLIYEIRDGKLNICLCTGFEPRYPRGSGIRRRSFALNCFFVCEESGGVINSISKESGQYPVAYDSENPSGAETRLYTNVGLRRRQYRIFFFNSGFYQISNGGGVAFRFYVREDGDGNPVSISKEDWFQGGWQESMYNTPQISNVYNSIVDSSKLGKRIGMMNFIDQNTMTIDVEAFTPKDREDGHTRQTRHNLICQTDLSYVNDSFVTMIGSDEKLQQPVQSDLHFIDDNAESNIGEDLKELSIHSNWLGTIWRMGTEYDSSVGHLRNHMLINDTENGIYKVEAWTYNGLSASPQVSKTELLSLPSNWRAQIENIINNEQDYGHIFPSDHDAVVGDPYNLSYVSGNLLGLMYPVRNAAYDIQFRFALVEVSSGTLSMVSTPITVYPTPDDDTDWLTVYDVRHLRRGEQSGVFVDGSDVYLLMAGVRELGNNNTPVCLFRIDTSSDSVPAWHQVGTPSPWVHGQQGIHQEFGFFKDRYDDHYENAIEFFDERGVSNIDDRMRASAQDWLNWSGDYKRLTYLTINPRVGFDITVSDLPILLRSRCYYLNGFTFNLVDRVNDPDQPPYVDDPYNDTFYLYARIVNEEPRIIVSERKLGNTFYQIYLGYVETNDEGITNIELSKPSLLNNYPTSKTPQPNTIPVSNEKGMISQEWIPDFFDVIVRTSQELIDALENNEVTSIGAKAGVYTIDREIQVSSLSATKYICGSGSLDTSVGKNQIRFDGGYLSLGNTHLMFDSISLRMEGTGNNHFVVLANDDLREVVFHQCYLGLELHHENDQTTSHGIIDGNGYYLHHLTFNHCLFERWGDTNLPLWHSLSPGLGYGLTIQTVPTIVGCRSEGCSDNVRKELLMYIDSRLDSDTIDGHHADNEDVEAGDQQDLATKEQLRIHVQREAIKWSIVLG